MEALKSFFPCFFPLRDKRKNILVDASTMQIHDIIPRIISKIKEGNKFVITRTNRIELNLLTTYEKPDISSRNASAYLSLERLYPRSFISSMDSSPLREPDARIIRFGAVNKNNVQIWTSDAGALRRASDVGCDVEFFDSNKLNPRPEKKTGNFWQAKNENGFLVLSNKQTIRSIIIVRDNKVYYNPANGFKLKIGDQIIVCIKKSHPHVDKDYIAFAAYTLISNESENNVLIDYTHQFYDKTEPRSIKNELYRAAVLNYIEKYMPDLPEECEKPMIDLKSTNWMKDRRGQTRRRVCSFLL